MHARTATPFRRILSILTLSAFVGLAACADGGSSDPQPGASTDAREKALAPQVAALARWSAPTALPLVPVSAANLPDGRVLMWSAEEKFSFGAATGRTYSLIYDPVKGTTTERTVTETGHNMFCPGTTNLADGRLLVNGGISSERTSIFDPATGAWSTGAGMNIPRGYQANTLLADGTVLTLGGSWSGGVGNKHGEVWSAAGGWRRLSGVPIDSFLSSDPSRNFGMDSHFWLIPAGNGKVLHAGPGVNMHWIDTAGNGRVIPAGPRGDDQFSISGTTVMFDTGRILKAGGGPGYDNVAANANAYVIDVNSGLSVRKIAPMAYRRAFHNSVVLPNGQVLIVGGQTVAVGFSDNNSVLVPELFDPADESFSPLPPISVPRNYHSVALLLPDARVVSAGGGLCGAGCAANHPDLQVLSPHYLFNADGSPATRPVITAAPASVGHGQTVQVRTDSAVSAFAIVRMSSTTHTVNNDQRRLSLSFRALPDNTYAVDVPSNPGFALPGDWMLFAMNAQGTPSIARIVRISLAGAPTIAAIDDQSSVVGAQVAFQPSLTVPGGGTPSFAAQGLPPGLSINAATGLIQGVPDAVGSHRATLRVSAAGITVSTDFTWQVSAPGVTRYVRIEALSEVAGNPWTSAAEFVLLDANGQPLNRGGWRVSTDSEELSGENGAAANAVDGNPATIWHTRWQGASPAHPHWLVVDLGAPSEVSGLRYLPRQDASANGTIDAYRVFLSADGVNWGVPVAQGNFAELGAVKAEKAIYFRNVARARPASQSSTYGGVADARRAVDGVTGGDYAAGSVSHTNSDANAWWEVDLGQTHALDAVRLWNRSDCCAERLANFYVFVSDTPMTGRTHAQLLGDAAVWRTQIAGAAPRAMLIPTAGARGRYVRVQLAGTNFLQLAEVEVHGRPQANRAPVATSPAATVTEQGVAARIAVSASDPDGDLLSFSATGLPPGTSISAASGVITGAPSTAGTFDVTVLASDGRGGSAAARFDWTVLSPTPVLQPVSAPAISSGATVTYSATTANAGAYTYQWNFGDGSAATAWSSTQSATHTYAAPGVYQVTLSARTDDGRSSSRTFLQSVQGVGGQSGRSSAPILVEPRSGASARVWVVNPDNDSVSVIDAATRARVAEIAVGRDPRTLARAPDGRIWVVNRDAASISIVSPSTLAVVQTVAMPAASQPFGIVISADGTAWVSEQATGRIARLSAAGARLAAADVGPHPRHLALDATASRLLVSRFITTALPGESTAVVQTSVNGAPRGGELLVLDAASLAVQRTVVLTHSEKSDTTAQGRGVPNYLGAPALAPDGASAWIPGKQDNIKRGRLRDGRDLDFQNTVRAITSRVNLTTFAEDTGARVDHDNSGLASAALFHPGGAYLFVALETSRHVAVVDVVGQRELFRVDAGRAPQGLALSADGNTLYVHDFMDRTVGVHDLSRLTGFGESAMPRVATVSTVGAERLAADVLRGKQFFYDARDPRLARDGYLSCASCHADGGHDGRTWDLTGRGEGLRNTIALRGRAGGQGRLHWSANFDEVQDFEAQIRTLAQGTGLMTDAQYGTGTRSQPLGDRKAGVSADLDALAAYVGSLTRFDPSPLRNADGSLTVAAQAGRVVFTRSCAGCHGTDAFTDSATGRMHDIGTIKPASGTRLGAALTGLDTPTLRDAWATAPYLHDGSAATIEDAVRAHTSISLASGELDQVAAFVRAIGAQEPAVTAGTGTGTGLRAAYYPNLTLAGTPALSRVEVIDADWGTGSPGAGVPADNFSVRWRGDLDVPVTGTYRFETSSDDGVRVWVDNTLVIDNWTDHAPTVNTSAAIPLTAGRRVALRVEYYERGGGATMRLRWQVPGATSTAVVPADRLHPAADEVVTGLRGDYFANVTLSGTAALTRFQAVDFDWGTGSPGTGVPSDNFSARWTGFLTAPAAGTYRFRTVSDDGVRLWVNGSRLINNWTDHGPTTDTSAAITLSAGQRVPIGLDYYERGGGAVVRLQWLRPGTSQYAPVPASVLTPQ
jgi:YVTN family beta-propeller protein